MLCAAHKSLCARGAAPTAPGSAFQGRQRPLLQVRLACVCNGDLVCGLVLQDAAPCMQACAAACLVQAGTLRAPRQSPHVCTNPCLPSSAVRLHRQCEAHSIGGCPGLRQPPAYARTFCRRSRQHLRLELPTGASRPLPLQAAGACASSVRERTQLCPLLLGQRAHCSCQARARPFGALAYCALSTVRRPLLPHPATPQLRVPHSWSALQASAAPRARGRPSAAQRAEGRLPGGGVL